MPSSAVTCDSSGSRCRQALQQLALQTQQCPEWIQYLYKFHTIFIQSSYHTISMQFSHNFSNNFHEGFQKFFISFSFNFPLNFLQLLQNFQYNKNNFSITTTIFKKISRQFHSILKQFHIIFLELSSHFNCFKLNLHIMYKYDYHYLFFY